MKFVLTAFVVAFATSAMAIPPFPENMTIQNPADAPDQAKAGLLGVWLGDFGGTKDSIAIVVTKVLENGKLEVIYSVEESDSSHSHFKPPMIAKFRNGKLTLPRFKSNAKVVLRFEGGKVIGSYQRQGDPKREGLFRKVSLK